MGKPFVGKPAIILKLMKLNNTFKNTALYALLFSILPVSVFAQTMNFSYLNSFFYGLDNLFRGFVLPLLMSVAVVIFIWNVLRYFIWSADDSAGRETARIYIIYSLLGLVIIVAVWGIVYIILNIFGLSGAINNNPPPLPRLP